MPIMGADLEVGGQLGVAGQARDDHIHVGSIAFYGNFLQFNILRVLNGGRWQILFS